MESSKHQHQAMATNPLEEALCCPSLQPHQQQQLLQQEERKPRPPPEQALNCPRCNSTNTKFCYYNNYSLSQPRYFCKGCRRYWTKGGTLRNVPIGGGCRKNKRSSSSKKSQDQIIPTSFGALFPSLPPPPPLVFDPQDLSLAFSTFHKAPGLVDGHGDLALGSAGAGPLPPQAPGFLDVLRTGFLDSSAGAFDDLYYGLSGHHGNGEDVEGSVAGQRAWTAPFEALRGATPSATQEASCKSTADGDNRLFMGLQWQQIGGDGGMMVDPGRDYWNGTVGSNWHGLVNSSLI
ncbi:hypothetical protein Taro_012042 [Colocasia esculenta]|uniref:Dof zinc finger protein n=1 Tax=Colocasia esculenta TaxID=4460 RepID=A0A843U310_COLES|nr:hypothetical protein [Colocasia esculenta]